MNWIDSNRTVHSDCVVFYRTREAWGGLSNMAGGYPLQVEISLPGGEGKVVNIRTSEALYQACRFPNRPDLQKIILDQASPIAAKMKSKAGGNRDKLTRPDWNEVRNAVMYWCLRVKMACNYHKFSALLKQTADRDIVEKSTKDEYWGAMDDKHGNLHGENTLGLLLMRLRRSQSNPRVVEPLPIKDFKLLGCNIMPVDNSLPEWRDGDVAWYVVPCTPDGNDHNCLFAVKVDVVRMVNRATVLVDVVGVPGGRRTEQVHVKSLFTATEAARELNSVLHLYDANALKVRPDAVFPGFQATPDNWLAPDAEVPAALADK